MLSTVSENVQHSLQSWIDYDRTWIFCRSLRSHICVMRLDYFANSMHFKSSISCIAVKSIDIEQSCGNCIDFG